MIAVTLLLFIIMAVIFWRHWPEIKNPSIKPEEREEREFIRRSGR